MEPVKDDIGMWHPHHEDFNVPFVGVKSESQDFEESEGILSTSK